mgnify:CR=1 FL=1
MVEKGIMKLSDAKLGDEIIKTNVGNSCYIQKGMKHSLNK